MEEPLGRSNSRILIIGPGELLLVFRDVIHVLVLLDTQL
jgi:hypothetical protein